MRKNFWFQLLLVCAGIVVGSLVGELTSTVPWLTWLSYGLDFGMAAPATLNLHVLILTIGVTIRITISHILFVTLALLIGRAVR